MIWYGEAGQDKFAWEQSGLKKDGTFLDLGAVGPQGARSNSNSYALELIGWHGLLIDFNPSYEEVARRERITPFICTDAASPDLDWQPLLTSVGLGFHIDYLSVDIDDGFSGKNAEIITLERLFGAGYSFTAITIEHDAYCRGDYKRAPQRKLLQAAGYTLTVSNVKQSGGLEFEDWWTKS
jgi:hypothetical protein